MNKLIKQLIIILILIVGINVKAIAPITCNRNELDKYGVNKNFNITDNNKSNVLKTPCINANDKIYDFSGVLKEEEIKLLKKKIDNFIEKNNTDLVIVIDNIPYTYDRENEEYASDFYDYNDFGINYDKYSGILFLRNTYEANPYYDIYAFGNAQLYINQRRTDKVLDDIYNNIHNSNYLIGLSLLIDELNTFYVDGVSESNYVVDNNGFLERQNSFPFSIVFFISLGITIVVIFIMISKNKMVHKAKFANDYIDKNTSEITDRKDQFVHSHTAVAHHSSSNSIGGGHSHMGSSGGGHFSGGGRHG